MAGRSRIAVNIVTYNSAQNIDACLGSLFAQDCGDFTVTVIDNASTDDTVSRLREWEKRGLRLICSQENLYYARAHNRAIRETDSELVVTLNPDAMLQSDFLSRAAEVFAARPRVGSVNGKLLLWEDGCLRPQALRRPPPPGARIDSAGLMMYRSRRPYLRCNRQQATTHCLEAASIFGCDGACAVYRRRMLMDVAVGGEVFDEDFVMYREDVDLAWRAQLFGWDSYYLPDALGYHVRGFHLGRDRRRMSPYLKRHSVKNGWLLLLKNESPGALVRDAPRILPYQFKILAGLLTIEHSSLGALLDTERLLPRILSKRREIQGRRTRSDAEMWRWFQ